MTPDELSPVAGVGVGAERIALALEDPTITPTAGAIVRVAVDYSLCDDAGGVRLPVEIVVTSPSRVLRRRVHSRLAPELVSFWLEEGGRHLVTVREVAHNLWWGTLALDVDGDPAEPV